MPFSEPAIWIAINLATMWFTAPSLIAPPWLDYKPWLWKFGTVVFMLSAGMALGNLTIWMTASGLFDKPWRCWG